MVEGALNAAAEQLVEFSAYGSVLQRDGNRGPYSAPQGVYPCAGNENWLALSIATDEQWRAFAEAIGRNDWAEDTTLASLAGRRAAHDKLDEEIIRFTAGRDLRAIVEDLIGRGIPAAPVYPSRESHRHPQLKAREFFEEREHPIVGRHPMVTVPFRYATNTNSWTRSAAPLLGEHNRQVLSEIVGLSDSEIDALEAEEVIGTHPKGL
jgi:crotonobetainyl-CoA:carnitine CoA-transferase CaiB-like acyl-CoA transferase